MTSSGLYFHIPFCDGKCSYCAFYSVCHTDELEAGFIHAASTEADRYLDDYPDFTPSTVYVGGGTPTMLSVPAIETICETVKRFGSEFEEWTFEANPGSLSTEKLHALRQAGVNRLSIGVQAMDDEVLARLGRRHSLDDAVSSVGGARKAGFENIGIDLIACVPGVTESAWRETLDRAVSLEPSHVSVYALTYEEGTELSRLAAGNQLEVLPDEEQTDHLSVAEEVLSRVGLDRYEISNYAMPGAECRHNQSCWNGGEYLGVGPAAASHMAQRRWKNASDIEVYISAAETDSDFKRDSEDLTPMMIADELIMLGLRMREGVDLDEIAARSGAGADRLKKWFEVIARLSESNLLVRHGSRWMLTLRGRDLADYVVSEIVSV